MNASGVSDDLNSSRLESMSTQLNPNFGLIDDDLSSERLSETSESDTR